MKEKIPQPVQSYYFFREDFEALEIRIKWIQEKIKESQAEMGAWCGGQSAETYHDNFGWEEGNRNSMMWSTELRKLLEIRNHAKITENIPTKKDRVSIGCTITLEDDETGKIRTLQIGSYLVVENQSGKDIPIVSYTAPIVAPFIGASIDDSREVDLRDGKKSFTLVDIK